MLLEPVAGSGNEKCCRHGVDYPNPVKIEYVMLHGMASRSMPSPGVPSGAGGGSAESHILRGGAKIHMYRYSNFFFLLSVICAAVNKLEQQSRS